MKKFSVITIVLNDLAGIKRTAKSVQGQKYKNFEWIVIDGGSTDGTREYVEALPVQPDYWVSEPDGGVYCAINKGVRHASGEYVICMNAGDVFHSEKVLEKVANRKLAADVVYGDWIKSRSTGNEFCAAPVILPKFYFFNNNICHQAMFVKTAILQESGYDERYKIFADWARWQCLSMGGGTFQHLPIVVCDFEAEKGLSSRGGVQRDREMEMMSVEFPKSVHEENECVRKSFSYRFLMMESLVYQWAGRLFWTIKGFVRQRTQSGVSKMKISRYRFFAFF